LSNYYSLAYLKRRTRKGSSIIYNSLLKHGYNNFSLDILEYCEPNILIKREQYYLDILKPEYNILKTAGSLYGFKQSKDSIERSRIANLGRKHDEATKLKLSANSRAHPITAINNKTGEIKLFTSIRQTATFIGISHSYLSKCLITKKFYIRKGYYITKNLCNNNSKFSLSSL
jgi:NUMOD1 domain